MKRAWIVTIIITLVVIIINLGVAAVGPMRNEPRASIVIDRAPAGGVDMINTNFKEHGGMHIEGDISQVSAECILILRQIYKRNKEYYGQTVARGILINMLIKAVFDEVKHDDVEWGISQKQIEEYFN